MRIEGGDGWVGEDSGVDEGGGHAVTRGEVRVPVLDHILCDQWWCDPQDLCYQRKIIKLILPARLLNNINYLPLVVYCAFCISKMDLQTPEPISFHASH